MQSIEVTVRIGERSMDDSGRQRWTEDVVQQALICAQEVGPSAVDEALKQLEAMIKRCNAIRAHLLEKA